MTQNVFAQPPDVPSTIKNPATAQAMGMPAPPPDPPLISSQELQKLTGGPTLVTLSGVDLPTKDVMKAVFDAAKVPESLYFTPAKTTLSVDWKETPFWVVAAEVERQLGGAWSSNYGTNLSLGQFYVGQGSSLDGKVAAQSPFVSLIANSISRTATDTLRFGERLPAPTNRTKSDRVQLSLAAYFDPKLQIQTNSLRRISFQERGRAAPIAEPEDPFRYNYRQFRGPISELTLAFPNGVKSGTVFSRISGVFHTVLVSANETFGVPDVVATPKVEKTIANTRYALQSATLTTDQLTIQVTATVEGEANQMANQMWAPFNNVFQTLRVRDAAGQELRAGSSTRRGGTKSQGDFSFNLRNPRGEPTVGPYSLEWIVATETRSLDVPFELRDVVVP